MVRVDTVVTEGADIGPAQTRAGSSRRSGVRKSSAAHPSADTIQQRSRPVLWRLCAGCARCVRFPAGGAARRTWLLESQVGGGCSSARHGRAAGQCWGIRRRCARICIPCWCPRPMLLCLPCWRPPSSQAQSMQRSSSVCGVDCRSAASQKLRRVAHACNPAALPRRRAPPVSPARRAPPRPNSLDNHLDPATKRHE